MLILIFCVMFPFLVQSQKEERVKTIDSLELVLKNYKTFDTSRVDLLNKIGYEYWIMNPAISEEMGLEALEIAKVLPYPAGEAFASRVVGVSHWARGNLELSFKFLLESQRQYELLNDSLGIANSTLNLGMAYADRLDLEIAMNKYKAALGIFLNLKNESRIATTYTKMGDLYTTRKEFEKAYLYLTDALKIYHEQNFLYGISEVNGMLGEMFIEKREYTKSLSHTLMAIEASAQRVDRVGLGNYYYNLGLAHELRGDHKLAKVNYEKSLGYAEEFNLKKVQRDLYLKFKDLEEKKGNFRLALSFFDKYNNVKDEIFNLQLSNTISNLESQHSYDQRQSELALAQRNLDLLTEKNKANKSLSIILLLALVSLASLAWGILGSKNRKIISKDQDLKNASLRESNLSIKIQQKEQEMTSYTLNFIQKNEAISDLKTSIQEIKKSAIQSLKPKLNILERKINTVLRVDEDWDDFRKHFENMHPTLINNLIQTYPGLTKNEYKLIALIRLNLSSKEISTVLGISPDSVKTARYRLRKKLLLNRQEDLFDFLIRFES